MTAARVPARWPLVLLSMLCAAWPAPAAPAVPGPAAAHSQLDLVVLIDQSGSMWGHPQYHPQPNDRYGHRIGATRAILERLAADVRGSSRVHRFSVVDFGDAAEVSWSNQVLRYDPGHPDALGRHLAIELPRRVTAKEWVGTNTPEALAAALAELRRMDAAAPLPERRRVVLLITDGRPQRPPATLEAMKGLSRARAEELLATGAELWVVALNDSSNYWLEGDGAFWEAVVGDPSRTHLAERAVPDLPRGVDRMVDTWLGLGKPVLPDPRAERYVAPPYLGSLAFRVSFDKPRDPAAVTISAPDGRTLPRVSTGSALSTYARFALGDPPSGVYSLHSALRPVYWAAEPHPPAVRRLAPAVGADLEADVRIAYRVELGSGRPLVPLASSPLTAAVEVSAPDGRRVSLAAAYQGDGKFVSHWRPSVPGLHLLRLSGLTQMGKRRIDVFLGARDAESTVEVSTARPLWLRLEGPDPETGLSVNPWARSARVRLVLVGSDGRQVNPRGIVARPEDWLRVEQVDRSGVALGDPVPLAPDAEGHFEGNLPIDPDWWNSPGIFGLGQIRLRLRARQGALPPDRVLRGIALPERAEELRVAGDPLSVGPIEVELSRWLVVAAMGVPLAVALALLVLGVPLLVRWWRLRKQRPVELRFYDIAGDPSGADAQSFRVGGATTLKLDGKVRLTMGGDTKTADRVRVTLMDSPGRPRARLRYRWRGEKRIQETYLTVDGGPKNLRVEAPVAGRPVAELAPV
jgi:hypothetical protein